MSSKRGATSDLNHDNWDQEEKAEEAGRFKVATEEEINRRVIKRAARRIKPEQDGPSKTPVEGSKIFAGLAFASPAAPQGGNAFKSFSFLANSKATAAGPDKVDPTSPSPWKSFITPVDVGSASKSNEPKTSIEKSTNIVPDTNGQPSCGKSLLNSVTPKTDASVFPSQKPSLFKMDFGDSASGPKRNALVPNVNPPFPSNKLDSASGATHFQAKKPTSMETANVSADALKKPIFSALETVATQQPKFPSATANFGLGNGNSKPNSFSAFGSAADLRYGPSSTATNSSAGGRNNPVSVPQFSGDKINKAPAPNKTGRSAAFLRDLAEVNTGFVQWVQEHLEEDSTSILTRCFVDYIAHVQSLFDEEKKLDLTPSESRLLTKQENVLNEIMVSKNAAKASPLEDKNNGDVPSLLLTSQPDETMTINASRVPGSTARITISVNGDADKDTGTYEPTPTIRYCKIPSDAPEIQVTFYSERPLKISCMKELEPNVKESVSLTDETCKPIPASTEKPFGLTTMTANSNAIDKSSNNLTGNSNATEKPSLFGAMATSRSPEKSFGFGTSIATTSASEKPFSFGTSTATTSASEKPFSFGTSTTTTSASEKPFSFGTSTTTTSASEKPFSFGSMATSKASEKPFSFGTATSAFSSPAEKPFSFANVTMTPSTTTTAANEDEAEDEPPKVEFTQVVEEGAVYTKRCKVFVRKDDSKEYQDRGVGTLFLKPVGTTGRTQLIVRAATSLGNLLMNTLLSPDMPIQKITSKAANTVMLMCIPTPETKPPPRSVLLRVKTEPDADELIKYLNENR